MVRGVSYLVRGNNDQNDKYIDNDNNDINRVSYTVRRVSYLVRVARLVGSLGLC